MAVEENCKPRRWRRPREERPRRRGASLLLFRRGGRLLPLVVLLLGRQLLLLLLPPRLVVQLLLLLLVVRRQAGGGQLRLRPRLAQDHCLHRRVGDEGGRLAPGVQEGRLALGGEERAVAALVLRLFRGAGGRGQGQREKPTRRVCCWR